MRSYDCFECRNYSWLPLFWERLRSSLHFSSEASYALCPQPGAWKQNYYLDGRAGPGTADCRGRTAVDRFEYSHLRRSVVSLGRDRGCHRLLQSSQPHLYRGYPDPRSKSRSASPAVGALGGEDWHSPRD